MTGGDDDSTVGEVRKWSQKRGMVLARCNGRQACHGRTTSPATPVMLSEHGGEIMGKVCLTRNLIAQCDKRLIIMCYRRRELADGTDQR